MEDIFQIVRKMLASDGLIDHMGNHWNYEGAWIGAHFPKVPELWALGGGPRLIDIATSYADGLSAWFRAHQHTGAVGSPGPRGPRATRAQGSQSRGVHLRLLAVRALLVEAGADYIAPSDLAPAALEPEEQEGVARRMFELCGHLKTPLASATVDKRAEQAAA